MFCPKRPSHAREVSLIEMFVRDNPATKDHCAEELRISFQDFISKCHQGYFEDMSDVSHCKWNGLDSDGLNLWLRSRGSNRCKNYHHKLESAIRLWIIGPILGHHILLHLACRCNIKSNIKRCNGINFRHFELQLIDRMQIKMQQLHNVIIFKNYINSAIVKTGPNFISVGIGLLHHSSECVISGSPDERLKHDLKFIASKMNVQCPPLPIGHKHEKKKLMNSAVITLI